MVLSPFPKLRSLATALGRPWGRLFGHDAARSVTEQVYRRLHVDPLEQRQLLSVSPANMDAILVNQSFSNEQWTIAGQSVAVDNDGDFVVVWTRMDEVLDDNGNRVWDYGTDYWMLDANVYARYFTDEVQRITLPEEALNNDVGAYARFSLDYNGNEVQSLSVTASYAPENEQIFEKPGTSSEQDPIIGSFTFTFDSNGDGTVESTAPVSFYDEDPLGNASRIQSALRALGGTLADVTVTCVDPQTFTIEFGDASGGVDQAAIGISATFSSGFYPYAEITETRDPGVITNIPISPDDPWLTAYAIEQYFEMTTKSVNVGPSGTSPINAWDTWRVGAPTVSVTPVSTPDDPLGMRTFDITFVGDSGKTDQPEMTIVAVSDELGNSLLASSQIDITTIKQSSPEFQVNAFEEDDPFTPEAADKLNQYSPAVTMDADGDFVIAWVGEVSDQGGGNSNPTNDPGNIHTNIFARRFSPIDAQTASSIPSVMPLGDQFQVNSFSTNYQIDPSVAVDAEGNFVITWENRAQDVSFGNSLMAQRFDRDGNPLGNNFIVNTSDTSEHRESVVALSDDGYILIAWTEQSKLNGGWRWNTTAKVYGPDGALVLGEFSPSESSNADGISNADIDLSASWDTGHHFLISWTEYTAGNMDNDPIVEEPETHQSIGVRAKMFSLFDVSGNVSGAVIREEFRANSATTGSPESTTTWPMNQWGSQAGLDADGDAVITYDGYGPDVDGNISWTYGFSKLMTYGAWLDYQMAIWQKQGLSDEAIAAERLAFEQTHGLLRGEANGVMYSSWDADPQLNLKGITATDSVINSKRDGQNARYTLNLWYDTNGGGVKLTLRNVWGEEAIVELTPEVSEGGILNVEATRAAFEQQLRDSGLVGDVVVRTVCDAVHFEEVDYRKGTAWEYPGAGPQVITYEIQFVDAVHDTNVDLYHTPGATEMFTYGPDSKEYMPKLFWIMQGDPGVMQTEASMGIQPDGDFVTAWTQYEIFNYKEDGNFSWMDDGGATKRSYYTNDWTVGDTGHDGLYRPNAFSNNGESVNETITHGFDPSYNFGWAGMNIYVREMVEDTDTAGPRVTDFLLPNGQRLADGADVTTSLNYVVVGFDEQLTTHGVHSVLDPNNWALVKDGVEVPDGISQVFFGLNMSATFSSVLGGSDVGSNKWEAVLVLDGNGVEDGTPSLADGRYEIVAKSSLRDVAGNALARTGFVPNGESISRSFYVSLPSGGETLINDTTVGQQETLDPSELSDKSLPKSPQTVASDADGDSVVVWVNQGPNPGVYAQLSTTTWTQTTDGRRVSTVTTLPDFRITDNVTATYPSVAMDADGDFIVTWSAQTNGDWNVWFQRFRRQADVAEGFVAVGEAQIANIELTSIQRFSSVAMDADGDFIIAWQSLNQDGSGYGVYAQRYTRAGELVDGRDEIQLITLDGEPTSAEFTLTFEGVSTGLINYDGDIAAMAAAVQAELEALGLEIEVAVLSDVEVAIAFVGKDGRKDQAPLVINATTTGGTNAEVLVSTQVNGEVAEFRVTDTMAGDQVFPAVAMDAKGSAIVTWTSYGQDGDAVHESNVYAKRFHWELNTQDKLIRYTDGDETLVNTTVAGNQKWSTVAMDADGDFVITWTSYGNDGTGNGYGPGVNGLNGIFAQRGNDLGNFIGGEFLVNTFTANDQQHSSVAMDADGDFIVTWESFQERPTPGTGEDVANSFGIYAQRYVRNDLLGTSAQFGDNGELRSEMHINTTIDGSQRFPSIALTDTGDALIVWSGQGPGDTQGIFSQRFEQVFDDAGPTVTDVQAYVIAEDESTSLETVISNGEINGTVKQIVVTFGENLNTLYGASGPASVLNKDYWVLAKNGNLLTKGVNSVVFGLNQAYLSGLADTPSGKYEAVVTFDVDPTVEGQQGLDAGSYTLTLRDRVEDQFGNGMDGDFDGAVGGDYQITFLVYIGQGGDTPIGGDPGGGTGGSGGVTIADGRTHAESPGAVAVDADGDYVLAWTASTVTTAHTEGIDRVYIRQFSVSGAAKAAMVGVTADDPTFADDTQSNATVAIDADGDFVVTWTNTRTVDGVEQTDVYARRFNSDGTAAGGAFRVNTFTDGAQRWSSVAMDVDGDFVVTWSSHGQEQGGQGGTGYGIYARRYDRFGQPLGAEFQVNTTTAGNQQFSSVAMDASGAFVIAWQAERGTSGYDIIAREFNADGSPWASPLGGEFIVNDTLIGNQMYPDVAMNLSGDTYVVTWSSTQHTDDQSGYAVYTKTFNRTTAVEQNVRYTYDGLTIDIPHGESVDIPIVVDQSFTIRDVNVRLNIAHQDPSDLQIYLVSPLGTIVQLVDGVPWQGDEQGATTSGPNGVNFEDTVFDDAAELLISDWEEGVLPPFNGTFRPDQMLAILNAQNAQGTWILRVVDADPPGDPDYYVDGDGIRHEEIDGGRLRDWSIDFTRTPAASAETLVNTTVQGNQMYSSVAMDHQGNFIVSWCGYGTQLGYEDVYGYGVFAQRFNAAASKQGGETRLNSMTEGMQWLASVGCDGEGNYVAIWTGDTDTAGVTNVYQYVSANRSMAIDIDGPLVTGVLRSDGTVLLEGGVLTPGTTSLRILFGESLSIEQEMIDGVRGPTLQSVLNPTNWVLQRSGMEISGAVSNVNFVLNPQTGKYEAILTFDGNGLAGGTPGLMAGSYTLIVRDLIEDTAGNQLDGDFDGVPGADSASTGYDGYTFDFLVAGADNVYGAEMRVNENSQYRQIFGEPQGTGSARETSVSSVAVDNDGDYVVVWTSFGQDDPNDPNGAGVYMRIYDRNNVPRTGEIRVNNITAGDQRNASVAIDADGDIVVVWESVSTDGTLDVYAQRFDAAGNRLANTRENRIMNDPNRYVPNTEHIEVLVNSTTSGEQFNPSVSTDAFGNFIVVWGSAGQSFGYFNNVNAQRFDYKGRPIEDEFQINGSDSPGVNGPGWGDSFKTNLDVSMSNDGHFIVVWDVIVKQEQGVVLDTELRGALFDFEANRLSNEFIGSYADLDDSSPTHARQSRNPSVVLSDDGTRFVLVAECYLNGAYAYFYSEHVLGELPTANDPPITIPPIEGSEDEDEVRTVSSVNPSVAMDANGNFAVAFNTSMRYPDSEGVYISWYHANIDGNWPSDVTDDTALVNQTIAGVQQFPTIAMTPSGDAVVVWQGNGVGDQHGIFVRTYDEPSDTAGPLATELRLADDGNPNTNELVGEGDSISANPESLLVVFDEELNASSPTGLHSVTNVNNWTIVNGQGDELSGAIHHVDFYFDTATNKWVAEVFFAAPDGSAGELGNGVYTLIARTEIHDIAGNVLGMTGFRPNGTGQQLGDEIDLEPATSPRGGFGFQFRVNNTLPGTPTEDDVDQRANTTDAGAQNDSTVARNAHGDYVVVWVTYGENQADIHGQRFDFWGREVGDEFVINSLVTGDQIEPDVAIDDAGNFVVVWSGAGETDDTGSGVFGQRFDADGNKLGGQFRVNQWVDNDQNEPAIAMNPNTGDFVVTWSSWDQDGSRDGVYGRVFSASGMAKGNEFRVNTMMLGSQRESDVAMDTQGNFIVTWASEDQNSNGWGIFGQRFSATGAKLGSEFIINTYQDDDQRNPAIAADSQGNFIITWASQQDGSGWGVYAQRFNADGAKLGTEFRVNQTTTYHQYQPAIAWTSGNAFVITWASFNQDSPQLEDVKDYGIYARMFNADGTNYVDPRVGPNPIGEFRVHAITDGDQIQPAVSMDANGHYVVTWTGPNDNDSGNDTDIYSRFIDPPIEETAGNDATPVDVHLNGTSGNDVFEFVAGLSPNTWTVKINGQTHNLGNHAGKVYFDGLGGQDTVIFAGSGANDRVELWPDHGTMTSDYYTVVVSNVESITATAGGGADTLILHDSAGDDVLDVSPAAAELTGGGFSLRGEGFESVAAQATTGGNDKANLYDSAGNDAFVSKPGLATIMGPSYDVTAVGFDSVKAYSTAGGTDTADLYDTPGNDSLLATPTYAKLTGEGYYAMATGFRYARAHSTGGTDVAIMNDSAGNDIFIASPTFAKLYSDNFYNIANNFRYVNAYGKLGGDDTASLYDSAGDDRFVAGYRYGEMYGDGYSIRADFFRNVTGYGNTGGHDVAELYDSAGDDLLDVTPVYAVLRGSGFYNRAYAFEEVNIRASGGNDTATLHDSALNDYLEADASWTRLSNTDLDFAYWVSNFDRVSATSNNAGDKKTTTSAVDFLLTTPGMWQDM